MRKNFALMAEPDSSSPRMFSAASLACCEGLCPIEPRYFAIACRRIEDAQRQQRLFA